jgi:ankyrin repeat protein/serine/threonine protein kinase
MSTIKNDTVSEDFINLIKTRDLNKIKNLYDTKHPDVNYQRKKDGLTALHMAYLLKNLEIIQFLIENGANISITDNLGDTPIKYMLDINKSHDPTIIKILEYTLTIPSLNKEDIMNIKRALNEKFIDIIKSKNLDLIKDYYEKNKSYIDIKYQRKKDGLTALHMAYGLKQLDIIKFLIENGADITIPDDDDDTSIEYMLDIYPLYDSTVDEIITYTFTIPEFEYLDEDIHQKISRLLYKRLPENKYKRLGMGSYGLVLSPSVNTKNNTKTTKIMFNKSSYNHAIQAAEKIKKNMPLLGSLFEKYPKKYTYANIATNNEQVGKILKALKPSIKNTNEIYPILMDNLGLSFADLNDTHLPSITALSIKTILEQYNNLADAVIQLKTSGYIHGDIREYNVMINLSTGTIKIIDFDWLLSVPDFKKQYRNQFYSHPPELIFAKNMYSIYQSKFSVPYTISEFRTIVRSRISNIIQQKYESADKIHNVDELENGVEETMENMASIKSTNSNTNKLADIKQQFETTMNNAYLQIDSYGLGYALSCFHKLLEKTKSLRNSTDSAIIDKLQSLSLALCHPSQVQRMSIEEFKKHILELLPKQNKQSSSVSGGQNRKKVHKVHKTKKAHKVHKNRRHITHRNRRRI